MKADVWLCSNYAAVWPSQLFSIGVAVIGRACDLPVVKYLKYDLKYAKPTK